MHNSLSDLGALDIYRISISEYLDSNLETSFGFEENESVHKVAIL